jgi:hypothetical protein
METHVTFDGHAPEPSRIVAKASEITGLPIRFEAMRREILGDLYEFSGHAKVRDLPSHRALVYSYRAGGVRRHKDEFLGPELGPHRVVIERVTATLVTGMNEPEGTQAVYFQTYIGQEPTLFYAMQIALEDLGGRPERPLSDAERQKYGRTLTIAELKKRSRQAYARAVAGLLIGCLVWPILLPVWLLTLPIVIPLRFWRASRLVHKITAEERKKRSDQVS